MEQKARYANAYTVCPETANLRFKAEVRLQPQELTDITGGHGGFYLWGEARYADGMAETFGTDTGWQVRLDRRYVSQYRYDGTLEPDDWHNAVPTGDQRHMQVAPIPPLTICTVYPQSAEQRRIRLDSGGRETAVFDRIYSAYAALRCDRACRLRVECLEMPGQNVSCEELTLSSAGEFRSFHLKSISVLQIDVLEADGTVQIEPFLYFSHYPVDIEGYVRTADESLNLVYDVCKWTLRICRQALHLDSPRHQELLACSGDYYIQSMMTAFTFGDMRLAALDVRRTAQWLEYHDGRMFHTNYSLIWVQWLEFVWQFTGDRALLEDCRPGLSRLLERFKRYLGDSGVLETPPDYMFVDWVVMEGYSMHHPPKCLGQTVLNAFYYKALSTAASLAQQAGWSEGNLWKKQATRLRTAFHRNFYDQQAQMYFDGHGDPVEGNEWQPANVPLHHFSRYANALAALYDLCPPSEAVRLVRLVADPQSILPPVQPYFMHFILQAVQHTGLTEEYGLSLYDQWKPLVADCAKGLSEGWIPPEPTYVFDHSHAWGGTPACHLPMFLTGFCMLEPGFGRISLSPQLYGLPYADVAFPTPYGMLRCVQRQGEPPQITVPEGLVWELVDQDGKAQG